MLSNDRTYGSVSANALMEYARNQKDRKIDCNDIARFPRSNVKELSEYELTLEQIFGVPYDRIRELAEAEREGRVVIGSAWIRCSERLPEQVNKRLWSRDVLATIKQKTGNRFVVVAYYHYGCEQWKMDDMMDGDIIDVLAWQPLPEPFQGEA